MRSTEMEDRFAVYASPTTYGAKQGWFAEDVISEIIRYGTEEDARADLTAIANGFSPIGLRAKEVNPEKGYARLTDERGREVAVLEVAAIATVQGLWGNSVRKPMAYTVLAERISSVRADQERG
jgi:hypothetical protein